MIKQLTILISLISLLTGCTFIKINNPHIKVEEGKVVFQEEIKEKENSTLSGPILTNFVKSVIHQFDDKKLYATRIESKHKIYSTILNEKVPYGSIVMLTLNNGKIKEIEIIKINKEEFSF